LKVGIKQGHKGTLIKWKESCVIGRGSFGEVVKAMNIKEGTIFAVKKLNFMS
jgi:serine/threonine protein kinase